MRLGTTIIFIGGGSKFKVGGPNHYFCVKVVGPAI